MCSMALLANCELMGIKLLLHRSATTLESQAAVRVIVCDVRSVLEVVPGVTKQGFAKCLLTEMI